ncbi:MAG: NAD(P)/FAD-dependent oxidoreductase [Candidatus Caldarchaeum sp.]
MSMAVTDVVVVGAGHNGLITAGYLTKRGFKVIIVEQAAEPGGCVKTVELFKGFKVNLYSFEQYLIHSTPVIQDLELVKYGLKYYQVDPVIFSPFPDGNYILFYRDLEKTIRQISKLSFHDAVSYRKLAQTFEEINSLLAQLALIPPLSFKEIIDFAETAGRGDLLQIILASAKDILDEYFETDYVKVPIAFLGAAAIGLPPSQKGTGWTVGWHLNARNLARPYGGSAALIDSLVKMIKAHGGELMLNSEVTKIKVKDGKASGVKLSNGFEIETKIVVAACDPKQTFLKLVGEENLDSDFVSEVKKIKVANGIAMKADFSLDGLPSYVCNPSVGVNECHKAATFIAPSVDTLEKAYDEYKFGKNPKEPGLMVSIPSASDPSLSPPDKHILSLETRYTPYELSGGERWDDIKNQVAEHLLDLYSIYAPDVKKLVVQKYVASPVDWERELKLPRGNFFHVDMTLDQMFALRPHPRLNRYRTPIRGLYITGAGTHPGGGVSGAPGYNAAMTILNDLGS